MQHLSSVYYDLSLLHLSEQGPVGALTKQSIAV